MNLENNNSPLAQKAESNKNNNVAKNTLENLDTPPNPIRTVTGRARTTRQGFGFVEINDSDDSVFVPPPLMRNLMPDDEVVVTVKMEDDREFVTSIDKLLESTLETMMGRVIVREQDGKLKKQINTTRVLCKFKYLSYNVRVFFHAPILKTYFSNACTNNP